jgi:hypothetical protein
MKNWLRILQTSVFQDALSAAIGQVAVGGMGVFVEGIDVPRIAQCIIDCWLSAEGTA